MHSYVVEKVVQHRLEEAFRMHRNANFVRQERAILHRRRAELLWSLLCRLTSWTALRICVELRDGAAPSPAAGKYFWS